MSCLVTLAAAFLLFGCAPPESNEVKSEAAPSLPEFSVVDEETTDTPLKTQVEQHLVVSGNVTEEGLRALLMQQYDEIMSRRGFEYHGSPTNVYVYTYETREQAEAGQGLWLAMLDKNFDASEPNVSVKSELIANFGAVPEEQSGLSEDERRSVFHELIEVERRAWEEAEAQVPDDIYRQGDVRNDLTERYEAELAERRGLTGEQLDQIGLEGVTKQWPMPPAQ